MQGSRVPLGELLVSAHIITRDQLEKILEKQKDDPRRLGTLLIESGYVSETQVVQVLSQQLSVPWVSLYHVNFTRELLNLVPRHLAERSTLIPIFVRRVRGLGQALYIAMDDPTDTAAVNELQEWSGLPVRAMVAPPSEILSAIRAYYTDSTSSPPRPLAELVAPAGPIHAEEPLGYDTLPAPRKNDARTPLVSIVLEDGSKVRLPATDSAGVPNDVLGALTTRDLIQALRAKASGADVSQILAAPLDYDSLFAALLSLLLNKGVIADWEFVDVYKRLPK